MPYKEKENEEKCKNSQGGGENKSLNSLTSTQASSLDSRGIFKPFIASSLALALGVSVAVATDPSISYSNNGGSGSTITSDPQNSWKWAEKNDVSIGSGKGVFLQLQSGTDSSVIKNLTFTFDNLTDSSNTPQQSIVDSSSTKTLSIKVDGNVNANDAILTFSNKDSGKGILLGNDATNENRGTLTFDFLGSDQKDNHNWNNADTTHKRKMVLDLTATTTMSTSNQKVSLVGNILIKAGMGVGADQNQSPFYYKNSNVFEATFGGDMIGNITIAPSAVSDPNGELVDVDATSTHSDIKSTFIFNDSASLFGSISSSAGENTFIFNGGGKITGNVAIDQKNTLNAGAHPQNRIVFAGGNATLGESGKKSNIKTDNSTTTGLGQRGSNTLVFHTDVSSSTLHIDELSVTGNFNGDLTNAPSSSQRTFNILSFNNSSSNTVNIQKMSAILGNNIIGKDIVTYTNSDNPSLTYNNQLFDTNDSKYPQDKSTYLKNGYAKEFIKTTHSANGTFIFDGDASSNDALTTNQSGVNLLNIKGSTTIKGNIISSTTGKQNSNFHNNLLVLTGTLAQIGESSSKVSIKIDNETPNSGTNYGKKSNNTVLLDATTIALHLSELSVKGDFSQHTQTFNVLSFNASSNNQTQTIGAISAQKGSNILGGNLITQSAGYNTAMFGNANNPVIQAGFLNEFEKTEHKASGNFVIDSINSIGDGPNGSASNYINVSNLQVTGTIDTRGATNYIKTHTGTNKFSGNITNNAGTNTIISETGATLQLGEQNNKISIISNGGGTATNTITSDIITAYINELKTESWWAANSNVITAKSGAIDIATMSDGSKGSNIIHFAFNTENGVKTATDKASSSTLKIANVNGNSNEIISYAGTNTIGSISGGNTITLMGASNSITGNISASGSVNTNITATSLIIGANDTPVSLIANGDSIQNNTSFGNTINVSGNLTAYFSSIKASGTAHQYKDAHKNSVSGGSGSAINVSGNITATRAINGTNSNNLAADTIIVNGDIIVTGNGGKGINNLVINGRGSYISGNITTSDVNNGQNNFTLNADSADLTLKGKTSGGTTHQITALNATGGNNTLTLDNSASNVAGAMSTTIHSIGNGENLAVILNGKESGKGATLILDNTAGTTLKSVSLGTTGKANTISFKAGANTIQNAIASLENGKDLTIELSGANTSLNLAGLSKGSGTANIAVKTAKTNATLSGGVINASALSFADNASLAIRNANATFESASGNGVLILDSANAGASVKVTVNTEVNNGSNLTAQFNGNTERGNELILNNGGTLKAVTLGANSTNNTLAIKGSNKTTTITEAVNATQGTGITFDLGNNTTLDLKAGADSRLSAEESKGAITLKLQDSATATISGSATNITNLDFTGSSAQTLNVKNSSISFGTITANNANGSKLVLDTTSNKVDAFIGTITGNNLDVELNGNSLGATLTINGNGGTIKSIKVTNGDASKNIINFSSGTTTITNAIDSTSVANSKGLALNLKGGNAFLRGNLNTTNGGGTINVTLNNSSTLSLGGATNTIKKLTATNGTIDLSSPITSTAKEARSKANDAPARKTLTIGASGDTSAFSGNLNFVTYANTKTADQIIVDGTGSSGEITIFAKGELYEVLSITREDNIKVAEIKNSVTKNGAPSSAGGTNTITVKGGESEIDGIVFDLVVQEDESNKGNYYLGKTIDKGVDTSIQKVASTALTVNYDLYLANFNSLNKRMGELRDNPYNQGVWARVFGGAMSNDFGAGSKTNYVTAQAGYDYSLTLSNARNYMGVAIAYGKSWTKSNEVTALSNAYLSNVDSNMVEVGIYNSFVMDSGWYNDTILKFDYIMSDFTLKAGSVSADNHTNNFAMVLSDEFGYRYKFGSEKSWYIDPQVEVAFGYFNQSDFNHALSSSGRTKLEASQDSILTLRTRAGMSLGKKFSTQKGFASLYVGAFYEYDYIEGGNATTLATGVSNTLNQVGSNGRTIVNVGSNIELTDGVRMYIDVEKSFGDKQRTFMQFNFGARYSFGEKTLSAQNKTNSAPLKIENQNSQEQSEQTNLQEQNTSSKE